MPHATRADTTKRRNRRYMLVRMYRLTRICRIGDESTDYHFCLQFCILGMDRRLILQNTLRTRWKLRPVLTVCKFGAR